MEDIKLEVGKSYMRRNGEKVKIIAKDGRHGFDYRSDDILTYRENGKASDEKESKFDIISEIADNLKVKVLMYNNEFVDIQPNGNIVKIPFPKIFNTPANQIGQNISQYKKRSCKLTAKLSLPIVLQSFLQIR